MPVTTFVNKRSVVHRASQGFAMASPDPCMTPGAGVVPYVNVALSKEAAKTAATVHSDGEPVMKASSIFATSVGDEPGTLGGTASGVVKGAAKFFNFSFDVLIEGEGTPRALDPMMQNMAASGLGAFNAATPAEVQPASNLADPMFALLCEILCLCNFRGLKTRCARRLLATRKGRCWDPRIPGVYVEASYAMTHPPTLIPSKETSDHWNDKHGNPLPLPLDSWPPKGSRRPDVVVAKNPKEPPTPDNIENIYEFKFKGDSWKPGQQAGYDKIARPGGGQVKLVSAGTCPPCGPHPLDDLKDLVEKFLKDYLKEKAIEALPWMIGFGALLILIWKTPAYADEDPDDKDHTDPGEHDKEEEKNRSPEPTEDPPFHNDHEPPILPVIWPPRPGPAPLPGPEPELPWPRKPTPIQILWPAPLPKQIARPFPAIPVTPYHPPQCDWPAGRGVFR